MSNLTVSNSNSNTAGTTTNPQASTKNGYQGQSYSLQNSTASGINNSPRGGKTVLIKNFSLNSIAKQNSSTTSSNNGISSVAITMIIIVVIVIAFALYLVGKTNKITTKRRK